MATRLRCVLVAALGCTVGCSGADAVFVESRVSQAEKRATDDNAQLKKTIEDLSKRLESLEQRPEPAKHVGDDKTSGTFSGVKTVEVNATLVQTNALTVLDADGNERILLQSLIGPPSIHIRRKDKTTAIKLCEEEDGESNLLLYDTTNHPRIGLTVRKDGNAVVRIVDTDGKVRVGMITTADNEGEFLRFDKFGNLKTFK